MAQQVLAHDDGRHPGAAHVLLSAGENQPKLGRPSVQGVSVQLTGILKLPNVTLKKINTDLNKKKTVHKANMHFVTQATI